MRRLLDEVDVLWSHVAEADAVGDYVVTLEKISEKQLIADHLAVLDQEHDRTLGERIWDSSCVEELRKRLQADENKMDVDFIAGGKVHHAQRLT
ncbi:4-hydroxy-3-methylbut-2-enyl diphosphate reductase [Trichinella spiralis]|uniref:4-hydroxy-3-methylbut-2-enyl diphosphate reductase n=1 Tax=Trichinella spiralis TaxID=6334 RepID=A0ABR3K6B8_TRISP